MYMYMYIPLEFLYPLICVWTLPRKKGQVIWHRTCCAGRERGEEVKWWGEREGGFGLLYPPSSARSSFVYSSVCRAYIIHVHYRARQSSNPWTAAVSSLLALISREYTYMYMYNLSGVSPQANQLCIPYPV